MYKGQYNQYSKKYNIPSKGDRQLKRLTLTCILIVFIISSTVFSIQVNALNFPQDLHQSYAEKEIKALVKEGIVNGYEDGTFKPKHAITRAEFAKMLAIALELPENRSAASVFQDVPQWAKPYVGALVEAGITEGIEQNLFGSHHLLSREQMAVFLIRAMGLEETLEELEMQISFKDQQHIAGWARPHVAFAQSIGLIKGVENQFLPKENAQRQAVARLIYELKFEGDKYTPAIIKVIFEGMLWGEVEQVELLEDGSARITFVNGDVVILTEDGDIFLEVEYTQPTQMIDYTVLDWYFLEDDEKLAFVTEAMTVLIQENRVTLLKALDYIDIRRETNNLVYVDGGFELEDRLIDAVLKAARYLEYVKTN